jgi:predicted ATPase
MFEAVASVLTDASVGAPVVLVIDDLHWGDTSTLMLLRHLLAPRLGLRLLVVTTYRDSELSPTHPLRELLVDLHGQPGVERLAVAGLGEVEIKALMQGTTGHELDPAGVALVKELREETDGNPFFVAEILRDLAESGAIVRVEDRWVAVEAASVTIPQGVREVIAQRVRRLGEAAHRALTAASAMGQQFDLDLLARVLDEAEEGVLRTLEGAVGAALVTESPEIVGRFGFGHALIQHALYDELSPTRRQRAHRRIAEALEATAEGRGRVAELAHHWSKGATAAELPTAVEAARRAGDAALAQLAPDEAARWYFEALKLERDSPERCELLIRLGDAQRQAGDPAHRRTLMDTAALAQALGDGERLVRAALTNSRGDLAMGAVDHERVRVLQAALAAVGEGDSVARARILADLGIELLYAGGIGPPPLFRPANRPQPFERQGSPAVPPGRSEPS